jgi:cob(I)alamin adenosyltransferase
MKIYTKTGDAGETGLWGGERVTKDNPRVQAYGTVDECNAAIGVVRASSLQPALDSMLAEVQNQLFVVGSDLASPDPAANVPRISAAHVEFLEQSIDSLEGGLAPLRQFIVPGGTPAAAHLHLARTICRRAEREVIRLAQHDAVGEQIAIYLNRLSDFLFVAARSANAGSGVPDVPWHSPRQQSEQR